MTSTLIPHDVAEAAERVALRTGNPRFRELVRTRPEYAAAIFAIEAEFDGPATGEFAAAVHARSMVAKREGRIRVGYLAPAVYRGGAEVHGLTMVRRIHGVAWVGAAAWDPGGDEDMKREFGKELPFAEGRGYARHLAGLCDVLICWAVDPEAVLAGVRDRPAVVVVAHSPPESDWGVNLYRGMRGADEVVLVSELCRTALPEPWRSKARLIRNAADPARLEPFRTRAEQRKLWGVGEGDRVVLAMQRLSAEKGCRRLVELARAAPELSVVAVGGGAELGAMRAAALPNLKLPGPDADVGSAYAAADALAALSDYESFGLTIAEAWLARLPAVTTNVGVSRMFPGLSRIVPFDATGGELAAALRADAADPEGTARRAARAYEVAAGELGIERFAASWEGLIRDVASRRAPAPPPSAVAEFRKSATPERRRAVLDAVAACPERGRSIQPTCCNSAERTECRAGRGKVPGLVTLDECLACKMAVADVKTIA